MNPWIVIGVGIVVLLVAFIIIQRRKPEEADKIAGELDSAFKSAKDKLTKGKQ
jgi:hypothetical protein